ncbi:hypothetical protein RJ640_018486 [Escallonia rubra]|uniref:Uncharacterized protein n=1 Tax=Escallonia rubra TaxID=112253 RepID=A0AA88QLE8_9ASTE|nr:hypothetical protein RJ640_018486 [Escallonia rubra]
MASLRVQILSRKLVKPSNPTPDHLRNFKLSLFDQLAPPTYINIILYYLADDEQNKAKSAERCTKLEKSLSKTLTQFYPLAGRLIKDDHVVDCNDEGVEYLEAKVYKKLAGFLQGGPKIELLNQFVPQEAAYLASVPLLAIQINVFDCGGLVLGLRVSHKIADTSTIVTFINGWARTCHSEVSKIFLPPSFGSLASLFPLRCLSSFKPPPVPLNNTGAKIVTKMFLFDAMTLSRLKARASASNSNDHPTRVVVVMVLIWRALIGTARAKHGQLRDSILAPAMNLRGKIAKPIPEDSFGNFWMPFTVRFIASKSQPELQDLVALLGNKTKDVASASAKASTEDIGLTMVNAYGEVVEEMEKKGVDVHICTSWCKFPMYEADFGWGKPFWVSSVSRAYEMVTLVDSGSGDGIEAWVCLYEDNMLVFEQDADILAFAS